MQKIKTHLIVSDQWDEYDVKWTKKLSTLDPVFTADNKLKFAIVSNKGRLEINTMDFNYLTKQAKRFTFPKGRGALTSDKGWIYVKVKSGEELIGVVVHKHIRKYNEMWDKIDTE